jgi:hypothetical protein
MGMTVTTTTTLISNPSLLSVIIFGGVCYPAVFASAKVASQLSDRAAELGLDAVGLLQAGLEQLLDERPVSGRPAVAKYACNPCANSSSSGSVATSTSFLMPATAALSKVAIRRAKASAKPSISSSGISRFT